jgi:CHAD domain-containing protein
MRDTDLPGGWLGERVGAVIGERALLPLVRVKVRTQPLRVCNRDGKTVVRIAIEEPHVVGKGATRVPLGRRLIVGPVLGYQRDFERVASALGRRLPAGPGPLPDEALAAAGLPVGGVSSDVDVRLEPAMRADQAMAAICRRLADVVDENLPGVVADIDPEFLHDLRVAVRRSRSVLKEMRGVLPAEDTARSRADLRWIQEITGPTRDLDVLLHDWPAMVEPVPPAMAGDLQPLVDLLRRERAEAFAAMRRGLRSARFRSAWEAWRSAVGRAEFAGPDADRPVGDLAGKRIVSVYRAMLKMGSAIDDRSPPEALHELRKRGKELRYLLELFGGMWPSDRVKPLVGALKGLQDVLGHFQDDEIQVHELRSLGPVLAGTAGGTDSLIALGFVVEGLAASQQKARHDFAARFSDFAAPATRRVVDRTFRSS